MSRNPIIAGNWKMHKTGEDAKQYIGTLRPLIESSRPRIFIATPFTAIAAASNAAVGSRIMIGAQNMHDSIEGAFTGEVSAPMLKEAGASFVILGHSERRQYFHETNVFINKKIKRALTEGLFPLYCIGEHLEDREKKKTKQVLVKQLDEGLHGISSEDAVRLVIAYEPIWAIGTGKTATPEMAEDTHAHIREWLASRFDKQKADKIPLLYGGSVKPDNISELMEQPNIDGALVGGASLDPVNFAKIINFEV